MKAFSLLELLITICIISILLMVGAPSMRQLIVKNRKVSMVNNLVLALQYARSEAIGQSMVVKFCASSNHKTCGHDWNAGQIIVGYNKKVLRVLPALSKKESLFWQGNFGKNNFLQFSPLGTITSGNFAYCIADSKKCTTIIVNSAGRIRLT